MDIQKDKFSKIYDQCVEQIYRFIFLKVSSQEVAEDLTSEVFTRCWDCFKNNDKIDNPRAFLYQVARNLVTDHYREKGRAKFVPIDSTAIIDSAPGTEEKAMLDSDMANIRQAIANLKDDYQNVLIWHYLDDLPIPKVAEMMGRTEENTRVLLHRALESLRKNCYKSA